MKVLLDGKAVRLTEDEMKSISGGWVNPEWSKGMKPKHEGEICPDCGVCRLTFEQFQDYDGKREEVYYCDCCDYIKFTI